MEGEGEGRKVLTENSSISTHGLPIYRSYLYTFVSASYVFRKWYGKQNNGPKDAYIYILGILCGKKDIDNVVTCMDLRRGEFLDYQ